MKEEDEDRQGQKIYRKEASTDGDDEIIMEGRNRTMCSYSSSSSSLQTQGEERRRRRR